MGNRREEKKKAIPHLAAENSSIKTSSITSKEVMSLWKIKTDGEERHERNRIRRKRRKKETALQFYPVIHMRNIQASCFQEPDALPYSVPIPSSVVKKERNVVCLARHLVCWPTP
jgi:hypothetical protein